MPSNNLTSRFRQDLIVTAVVGDDGQVTGHLVKDPDTDETFEFGTEEFFLCQSLQGDCSRDGIVAAFCDRFAITLAPTDLDQFVEQLRSLGLTYEVHPEAPGGSLEGTNGNGNGSNGAGDGNGTGTDTPYGQMLEHIQQDSPAAPVPEATGRQRRGGQPPASYLWSPPNTPVFFRRLTSWLLPMKWPVYGVLLALIPTLPIALYTFINNQDVFWQDMGQFVNPLPFFLGYLFSIVFINLLSKLLQGVVCTAHGGEVNEFGFRLAVGFYPRFSIGRRQVMRLPRSAQLWTFGTPLLLRLVLFVVGMVTWYALRDTGTNLGVWALMMAHSAMLTFVFLACPFWPVDGYYWMVNAFRLPRNLLGRTFTLWGLLLRGRRIPPTMGFWECVGLLLFGLLAVSFITLAIGTIALGFAQGLASTFPGILGRGTVALLLVILLLMSAWRLTRRWRQPKVQGGTGTSVYGTRPRRGRLTSALQLAVLFALGFVLVMPYPYRPGGSLELLPPVQQEIQAQVDGVVAEVAFQGGDGTWVERGQVVAVLEAVDIENDNLTRLQQVEAQRAAVANRQSILDKLLSTPRPEEVAVARQRVAVARQELLTAQSSVNTALEEVEVARRGLATAESRARFSQLEAERFATLVGQGAISQQDYEDTQRRADLDRAAVEEERQTVKVKEADVEIARSNVARSQENLAEEEAQLVLVQQGPHPEDVQAARDNLAEAEAELRRLQQEQRFDSDQLQRTRLIMPMDGRLVTPYLDTQVGTYLEQGDTFAIVEDDRNIFGELSIPEHNAEEIAVGANVEVKLLAYPGTSIVGQVASVEPKADASTTLTSAPTSTGARVVQVIVTMPDTDFPLKAGMTGYAKIDGSTMPLIVAFTRPLVRFFQIEFWSWLP